MAIKYALFGGSFDPPHLGHTEIAKNVCKQLDLDEVIWIPANRNPLKRASTASPEDRLRMVHLAIQGEPCFSMSDIEVTRSGRSFAIDTVMEFSMVQPGSIWFVLGTDAMAHLQEWKSWEKLAKTCRFALCPRQGADTEKVIGTMPEWVRSQIDVIDMPPYRASSTDVRESLITGKSPELWLDGDVWKYIQERNLYKNE